MRITVNSFGIKCAYCAKSPHSVTHTHTRSGHVIFIPFHVVWLRMKLRVSTSLMVLEPSTNSWLPNAELLAPHIAERGNLGESFKYVVKP